MSVSHGGVGDARHDLVEDYRMTLDNVDAARTHLNEVLVARDIEEIYKTRFGDALREYNARQAAKGHPERQIPDYLAHVRASKQEKVEYEMVVQVGNRDTNPATDEGARELSGGIYRDFLRRLVDELPNLDVHEAVIHYDEATPHLHVKYVPWSSGNRRGLPTRNSLSGAHKQMGFATTSDVNYRLMKMLEDAALDHGVQRLDMGVRRARLSVEEYKAAMRRGEAVVPMREHNREAARYEAYIRKLESLVRDMYGYAVNREMELCNVCTEANGDYADCAACDEYDGACGIAKKRFEELYSERMAELGIETEARES